jgi:shikimate kinase
VADLASCRLVRLPAGGAATLTTRVGTGEGRPWLAVDQSGFIQRTLAERDPLYQRLADVVIDVDNLNPEQVADSALEQLEAVRESA